MELHERLYSLGEQLGRKVFDDPDSFRGALDDFLDEGAASTGDINLLVDGVRLGAFRRMLSMIDSGAAPAAAVEAAGELLARERGSADVAGCRWACAVLGYAVGKVSDTEVQRYRTSTFDSRQQPADGWISPTGPAGLPTEPASPPVTSPPVTSPPVTSPPVTSPLGSPLPAPSTPAPGYTQPEQWPPATPQPSPAPPRKNRSTLIAAAVVVVVVLALVGGVAWFVTAGPFRPPSDDPTRTAKSPDPEPAAKSVTCWDGEKVVKTNLCTVPRGEAGLRWVFPSFDRDFDTCEASEDVTDGKVRAWFCPFGGNPLEGVRYSEWPTTAQARANFMEDYGTPPRDFFLAGRSVGSLWERDTPNEDDIYRRSFIYNDWPFALSMAGLSLEVRDLGCERAVLRSPHTHRAVRCSQAGEGSR